MKHKTKSAIKNNLNWVRPVGSIFLVVSKWQSASFMPLRWVAKILMAPFFLLLRDDYYKFLIFSQKVPESEAVTKLSRLFPNPILLDPIAGGKSTTEQDYLKFLEKVTLLPDMQYEWARRFMEVGRLDLARIGFVELINRKTNKLTMCKQLQTYRLLGAVCFMLGYNNEALKHWEMAGKLRRAMYKPNTPKGYRVLGSAWFVAIGHVAMLDYYLKFHKLYPVANLRIVAQWDIDKVPGLDLLIKFSEMGIDIVKPGEIDKDYDKWAENNGAPTWEQLSETEKLALVDDFWEYDFPDGKILGYAHAAARIQQEWDAAGHQPLLQLTQTEKQWISDFLVNLGLPRDAWYVCLHVREAGFHKQWNAVYPSMRDAVIDDYLLAINQIVNAGGWVVRMGDSSMKSLPPMKNVIDYPYSDYKSPIADIMLAAGCQFFLGTNSGFATVPAIYNVRCLLTNWIPVGWPLWPTQDLLVPKLFKNKKSGNYLTLEEIFKNNLAFIQNWSDLPADIELVANTPNELADATAEMLAQCQLTDTKYNLSGLDELQNRYKTIASQYGAFTGSQLAGSFAVKYPNVFFDTNNETNLTIEGDIKSWQEQLNNNTMVTSS